MRRRARFTLRKAIRALTFYVALPAVLLLGLRLVWGWEADRRLARVKAELRAKGIRFEKPAKEVPEETDAFAALRRAGDVLQVSPADWDYLGGDGVQPWTGKEWTADLPRT